VVTKDGKNVILIRRKGHDGVVWNMVGHALEGTQLCCGDVVQDTIVNAGEHVVHQAREVVHHLEVAGTGLAVGVEVSPFECSRVERTEVLPVGRESPAKLFLGSPCALEQKLLVEECSAHVPIGGWWRK